MDGSTRIVVLGSPEAVATEAARMLHEAAIAAVADRGRFVLALCGGATPVGLYRAMAAPEAEGLLPWSSTHLLWGDERCVAADDERSNYRLADVSGLLVRPWAGVHRMPGELPPDEGAAAYEATLRGLYGPGPYGPSEPPALDAVLLGLGEDGHTASLFPGSPVLGEEDRWVAETEPHAGLRRLTLTLPVLRSARLLLFMVTGAGKASALGRVLSQAGRDLPARLVMPGVPRAPHRVVWLLDREAAEEIPGRGPGATTGSDLDAIGARVVYVPSDHAAGEEPSMSDQESHPVAGFSSPSPGGSKVLLDADQMRRTLARIAHEVAENADLDGLALVGIQRRGVELAERLASLLQEFYGTRPPTGAIDITFYRDDIDTRGAAPGYDQPVVRSTSLPFDVHGRTIVLVDDVLFTGRTIRAAIEALFDYGRPDAVRLAVLIDRGHRELPIRPDFVGKNVPTSRTEQVGVRLSELDGADCVVLERV